MTRPRLFLDGASARLGTNDLARRRLLAAAVTDEGNVWFARSAASGNLLAARTLETLRQQMAEGATPDISEVSHE